VYRDPRGRIIFTKTRRRHDPCECGRGKSFSYSWHPAYLGASHWDDPWEKPPDADCYLYRLDEIYPFIARGQDETIYWCEGEKDADAMVQRYKAQATSHHQGAGKATLQQAEWLVKAKRIVLVADLDVAGAFDVITRNNLLVEAGFRGELEIVRPLKGKDAADHIAAGYRLHEFVEADITRLGIVAERFRYSQEHNGRKYGGGDNA
jgi:hypothetical protein